MTDFEKFLILDMDTASRCSLVLIKIMEVMNLFELLDEQDMEFVKKALAVFEEEQA